MGDGGKGSAPRPISVKLEEFDAAWERIFKEKKIRVSGVPYEVEEDKLPKPEEKKE
jgi:hypothetical protein